MNIYKHNPVVYGHYVENNEIDQNIQKLSRKDVSLPLGEFDWDCWNAIYFVTQQRLWNTDITKANDLETRVQYYTYEDIATKMNYKGKDFIEKIDKTLDLIYRAEQILKNYISPVDGKKYAKYRTRIIEADGVLKDGIKKNFMLTFSTNYMICILRKQSNFTLVNGIKNQGLKGKFAKPFHEQLSGRKSLFPTTKYGLKELNDIFCTKETTFKRHNERIRRMIEQNPSVFKATFWGDGVELELL